MKLALLRFFAQRPLTLLALAAVGTLGAAAAVGGAALSTGDDRGAADQGRDALDRPLDDPRKILGRGWFDSWPEKRRDNLRLFYFGGGGVGLYEEGTSYRYAVDWFDLERQGDKLTIKFLQDGVTVETKFTISRCDEKHPFDLCLDLANSPRGPKRYYGFDDDEDYATKMPWAAGMLRDVRQSLPRDAEERTR
jgi:hypothetical protein